MYRINVQNEGPTLDVISLSMASKYSSRKFWFAVLALIALGAGFGFTASHPASAPVFGEYVTGVVGIAMTFLGGNVASQWVDQRHTKPSEQAPAD